MSLVVSDDDTKNRRPNLFYSKYGWYWIHCIVCLVCHRRYTNCYEENSKWDIYIRYRTPVPWFQEQKNKRNGTHAWQIGTNHLGRRSWCASVFEWCGNSVHSSQNRGSETQHSIYWREESRFGKGRKHFTSIFGWVCKVGGMNSWTLQIVQPFEIVRDHGTGFHYYWELLWREIIWLLLGQFNGNQFTGEQTVVPDLRTIDGQEQSGRWESKY